MISDSDYDPEDVQARRNSRGEGVVLLVGGLVMLAGAGYAISETWSVKLPAGLAGGGTFAVMMGLGMIVAPWSAQPFDADRRGDEDEWFKALPLGWKVWFCLTLVASFGVLIALLIKLGSTR